MIVDATGKVGRYYETQYWFKQAYLRWDYRSIPIYQEFQLNGYEPHTVNYAVSNVICNTVCDHLTTDVYQYYTQESYRAGSIYVQLTFHVITRAHIGKFTNKYYEFVVNKDVDNSYTVTYTQPASKKLLPGDRFVVTYKLQQATKYKECLTTYRPQDYGKLIYNLHEPVRVPDTAINEYNQSDYYSLDKYSFLRALGTVKTDIYIYFISIGVRSEEVGNEHTGSDQVTLINSVNFTHAYNAPLVTVGLKTEEYINSFQNLMVNFAIATLSFVKVTDIQP